LVTVWQRPPHGGRRIEDWTFHGQRHCLALDFNLLAFPKFIKNSWSPRKVTLVIFALKHIVRAAALRISTPKANHEIFGCPHQTKISRPSFPFRITPTNFHGVLQIYAAATNGCMSL
jgi:hypothetical protein